VLQSPEKIYRDRLWRQPDRFYLSKEQHAELFPSELYADEDIVANWKRLKSVWTARFDTALQKELLIKNLGKWSDGAYVLEMVAESSGKQIKSRDYSPFSVQASSSSLSSLCGLRRKNMRTRRPGRILIAAAILM
jgi:hypothetical protein